MQHLLVRRGVRQEQSLAIADAHATNDTVARNASMDHGNVVGELRLEHAVEVLAAAHANDAVGVGEASEDAHLVVVLKLCTRRHDCR